MDQVLGDFLSSLLNAAQVKQSGRDARLLIDVTAMAHEHARPNLCRPASAAFQSRLCPASSACIRRGVACPACGQLPARPAVPAPGAQRPDVSERGETGPRLRETPARAGPQLVLKPAQPVPILRGGRSGHLLIPVFSQSMIIQVAVLPFIAAPRAP